MKLKKFESLPSLAALTLRVWRITCLSVENLNASSFNNSFPPEAQRFLKLKYLSNLVLPIIEAMDYKVDWMDVSGQSWPKSIFCLKEKYH